MAKAKLSMRERYRLLTRDLDSTPTYVDPEDVYPYTRYEGIKIHDWDKWEDPFRLTIDSYCKYQAEKDKKLYAVIDSFAPGPGSPVVDRRALRQLAQTVPPGRDPAGVRGAPAFRVSWPGTSTGPVPRVRGAVPEHRRAAPRADRDPYASANYNKYYAGLHNWSQMHDRVWYLSVPKSFFDDGDVGRARSSS